MKKRTMIVVCLATLFIFADVCASASSITYSVANKEAKLTISDTAQAIYSVPETFENVYVTSIGVNAFKGNKSLKNVTLNDRITSVEWGAFEDCTALESINIPNGISYIEDMTFSGCKNLKQVSLPDKLVCIGVRAFAFSGLNSVKLPDGLKAIEIGAFENCAGLEAIEIPDSVVYIGKDAFKDCNKLHAVCSAGSAAEQFFLAEGIPYTVKNN